MIKIIRKGLFKYLKKSIVKSHSLVYLFWECTTRCNLNCIHCGSDCAKDSNHPDMPLQHFLDALDTIPNKPKDFIVVITGGEPLVRNDLEQCGYAIRSRNIKWGIVTNGYLYTKERHISLLNAGMGAVTISLDGLEENHNWLRNTKISFSKVESAIELMASATRLSFDVVTCVNSRNISELEDIYNFLLAKRVKAWRIFTIAPIGRAKENEELSLSKTQFRELMSFIKNKRTKNQIDVKFSCEGYVGRYENEVRDTSFFCRAGINIGSVLIDGYISTCPNIDRNFSQGNIYKDSLNEIWNKKFRLFRDKMWNKTGKCKNCKEYKNCEGNGMHYREFDNPNVLVCHNEMLK